MKILHVFPSFAIGGQQRRFALLANRLPDLHHIIVALDGDYGAAGQLDDDVRWEKREVVVAKGRFLHPENIGKYRRLLREMRPDLLCTYNWGSIEMTAANRLLPVGNLLVPQVHFEDGFGPDETLDRQKWQRVLARRGLLQGRTVVVPSTGLKSAAVKKWKLDAGNIRLIPNGVDLNVFTPSIGTEGRRVVIGAVGALRPEKNISRLIRMFHKQNLKEQARLVIAGDGPERARLEAEVTEFGLQDDVYFAGHAPDPTEIYRQLDIYALTSDTEQMPFGVMEAMACGLPVLATAVGDIPTMVSTDNRTFIISTEDEVALGTELTRLAHSRNLRESIGAANLETARQNFDLSVMVATYEKLFHEVAGINPSPETH